MSTSLPRKVPQLTVYVRTGPGEALQSIGKVISLARMKEAMAVTSHGGAQGGVHDAEERKAS